MKYLKERAMPSLAGLLAIGMLFGLSGCNMDVLNPKGGVGVAERDLIVTTTGIMLIVVIPVIFLSLYFAWRYRATNKDADYQPNWSHSTKIEIVIWAVPTLIIIFLGWITWVSTHDLDPYKPLDSKVKPIEVDVVALDWKWLFIYPEQGVASVNELALPANTPVNFVITSDSVMNSFFIPQLGGQIYAMAGMKTKLSLIADHTGDYAGLSGNFSGPGFSNMKFRALALSSDDFQAWVQKVKGTAKPLDDSVYQKVAEPSEKDPVQYFSTVDSNLFNKIVGKYNTGSERAMGGMRMDGMTMPAPASAPRG